MRRLVLAERAAAGRRAFLLGWSYWRRAHQALAKRCHTARRARERVPLSAPSVVLPLPCEGVSDAEWERVQSVLPPQKPRTGRPRHDHRTVLSGILWVLRTAAPWREMPVQFGKWNTAYVRYRLWRKQGLWTQIIDALGPPVAPPAPRARAPAREVSL